MEHAHAYLMKASNDTMVVLQANWDLEDAEKICGCLNHKECNFDAYCLKEIEIV